MTFINETEQLDDNFIDYQEESDDPNSSTLDRIAGRVSSDEDRESTGRFECLLQSGAFPADHQNGASWTASAEEETHFTVSAPKRRKTASSATEYVEPLPKSYRDDQSSYDHLTMIVREGSEEIPTRTNPTDSRNQGNDKDSSSGSKFTVNEIGRPLSHSALGQSNSHRASTKRPVKSIEEVRLIRHFIDHVAQHFDICDNQRHFATTIPPRVSSSILLRSAILATAFRHINCTESYDKSTANTYRQNCTNMLLNDLHSDDSDHDADLLATAVLMRHLVLMDIPLSSKRSIFTSVDSQIFADSQPRLAQGGQLNDPTYWVALQQEIHMAILTQKPIPREFVFEQAASILSTADDWNWTKRIIAHCAATINYCFGDYDRNDENFEKLTDYANSWMARKPACFRPEFYQESHVDENFPQIVMLSDHSVSGLQYFHLAMIMLSAYDPKRPRLGATRRHELAKMDVSSAVFCKQSVEIMPS